MLKKLLSVVLAAILCLSFVACGGGKTNRFAFSNSRNSKSHKDNLLNIP